CGEAIWCRPRRAVTTVLQRCFEIAVLSRPQPLLPWHRHCSPDGLAKENPLMTNITEQDINQLNSFLRGELSAVETYEQCVEKMTDSSIVAQLRSLQESHRRRAELLSDRVRLLGGKPAQGSGVWGSFAKLAEGSAKIFGESAAVSALGEGEEHGGDAYRR